ncbi:MAG: PAS domain S-box protein, partial [Nitrospirae bacterium]|nr:PAS domain S-box protein [Nitrospirota bacterium]
MDKLQIYEIIVKNLPLGFSIVDDNGTIIEANEAAEKIWGYKKNELIGKSHQEIIHGASDDRACPFLCRAIDRREVV